MRQKDKNIQLLETAYQIGVAVTIIIYLIGAVLLMPGLSVAAGYWLLGLSVGTALAAGTCQVIASILMSDQIYEDHGMTPPRKQKRHA